MPSLETQQWDAWQTTTRMHTGRTVRRSQVGLDVQC